jgi:multiple sugar transport system ATP-binding protein
VAGFIGSPSMNFFDVNVVADKDSVCCLESGGFRVPVPVEKRDKMVRYIGRKMVFGIRPEDIHMPQYLPAGITASSVQAEVDVIEMMGNEVYLHLIVGDKPFLARVDPRAKARPGEKIEVVFNMANMHAFDSETGETVAD